MSLTINEIKEEYNLHPIVAEILKNREIDTKPELEMYLNGDFSDLHSPKLIPNIEKIANKIKTSALFGDNITIFGDFDVDGVTSIVTLYKAINRLGSDVNVNWEISNRYIDGYGLSKSTIDCLEDTDLLITVDCGIS